MSQWDHVSEEFARASLAADQAPAGPDRARGHEAALRLALVSGSFAEKFVARLDLTEALMSVPCTAEDLVHVHWLRQALDTHPDLAQADRDAVLLRLRWAVDLVEDIPGVSLDALVAAIDDLAEALLARGDHLGPVHAARARLAQARGERVAAEREFEKWVTAPRDSPGDCPACELAEQARILQGTDPDRALALVAPVITGELTCGEGTGAALALDADLRLRRGEIDTAVTSFRRAWHLSPDDPSAAGAVGACLRILVRLGNADRAIDHLLPRLWWLGNLRTPRDRMWFAATAAFVLERASAVGLAPPTVDGLPVTTVAAELQRDAEHIAAAFDTRYGSTVTSHALAAAHDPALVPAEPTLPPTRLSARAATSRVGGAEPVPATASVAERAALLRTALASLETELDVHTRAWVRDRASVLPVSTREEWAAASLLDRVSAQDCDDPAQQRELLDSALAAARRAGDEGGATRCEGELALLEVTQRTGDDHVAVARERARVCAARLEASGDGAEAGGLWRRIAWFGRSADPAADLERGAGAYGRAGLDGRRLLCTIEGVMARGTTDPAGAAGRLDAVEPETAGRPTLQAMVLEVRARLARAAGDPDAAVASLRRSLGLHAVTDHVRHGQLLLLGDLLIEREAWEELEVPAADVVAAAVRTHDPVLLAHGQRLLGLAYAETGRPLEAAELLEAAVPVLRQHDPGLVARVGWALANVFVSLGRWEDAREAFATASADFEAEGHTKEAALCHWQAGNAAWDAGATLAAGAHFEDAVALSRASADVALYVEALRSRAMLRAASGDLDGGLAELDAAIPAGERLAAQVGADDEDFDGEVLEPHVLRQGAHLLAEHGRVDAAVERYARAAALVGADLELVLRAEAAAVLADDDRLEEAEPRLRACLTELHAAALSEERVDAAGALARALERAGRGEQAEDVWGRYGPEA